MHLTFREVDPSVSTTIENRASALIGAIAVTADERGPTACYPLSVTVKQSAGSSLVAAASDPALSFPGVVIPTETRGYCHPVAGVIALRANEPLVLTDRGLIRELRELGFIY